MLNNFIDNKNSSGAKLTLRNNNNIEIASIKEHNTKEMADEIESIGSKNSIQIHKISDKGSKVLYLSSKDSEDEKEKEYFTDSPRLHFFVNFLLIIEGKIVRIMVQFGDLYFAAILTNIYLEIVIIQICATADASTFIQIYGFISALIFAYLMRNICSIAYWELFQLKWLHQNPFESITNLYGIYLKKYMKKNVYYIVNMVLGGLFYFFAIGVFSMPDNNGQFLDVINFIIFIIIPFLKFIVYYFSYVYICFRDFFGCQKENELDDKCRNPFQYWIQLNSLTNQGEIRLGLINNNDSLKKKNPNLFEKIFFNTIKIHFKLCGKKFKMNLQTLLKELCAIISFIYIIYLFAAKGCSVGGVFLLIFLYFFSLIISIEFSTPMWTINSIYRWYLKIKGKYDRKYQLKCRKLNEKFGLFKVVDMLPVLLSVGLLLFVLFTYIFFGVSSLYLYDTLEKLNNEGAFKETDWERENFTTKNSVENIICNSEIFGLSILKISSFPLATYMSGVNNTKKYFDKTFFKEKIENITEMKFLDVHSKYGVVLLVNMDIPGERPLTIFVIQGSIKKLDWWVDIEMFCSSAIFTLLNTISLSQLESLTHKVINWLLTIPLRLLEKFTLFNKYTQSLEYHIDREIEKINGTRNILIAGHSLGGGLSKFLGLKYHKESIAFSGPGITPLEYKLKDEIDYKYYKMNLIDVIPDYDVIPRIENTAGIKYRVLCNKGFFGCHSIERTICQIGATCKREDLTGDLCMGIFREEYHEIRKLAGLKNSVPQEYK